MTREERRTYRNKLRGAVEAYRTARRDAAEAAMRGVGPHSEMITNRVRWTALALAELMASRGRP